MINSTLYKQIIGSLMYLTTTKLDIMYALSIINKYMEHPMKLYFGATKTSQYLFKEHFKLCVYAEVMSNFMVI